jgi:hypothetical protein
VAGALYGQSFRLIPPAVRRASGSITVLLISPPGKEPVALQWRISVPHEVLVKVSDIGTGSSAESVQKEITCAAVEDRKQPGVSLFACILAGGRKTIPNGPIATIRYNVPQNMESKEVVVRFEKGIAALSGSVSVDVPAAECALSFK